jgi:hypothetical protein
MIFYRQRNHDAQGLLSPIPEKGVVERDLLTNSTEKPTRSETDAKFCQIIVVRFISSILSEVIDVVNAQFDLVKMDQ